MGVYARAKEDLAYPIDNYSRVDGNHPHFRNCHRFNAIYISNFLMKFKFDIYFRDLLISALAFALLYWFFPLYPILIIGGVWLILGLSFVALRKINHRFWDRLTKGMQWIVQPILGTIIFCLILVPVGLLWRLFKKKKNPSKSTFKRIETNLNLDFFKKQW